MKASISNRIYVKAIRDSPYEAKLKKALTHELPPTNPQQNFEPEFICTMQRVSDAIVSFPSGRTDLIPEDFEIVDRRVNEPLNDFPLFRFNLRPEQEVLFNEVNDSGIIIANPSFGKTFTSLAIAAKFNQKTLIIVHTTTLRDQWIGEIEKCFGITDVGIIGGGKFTIGSIFTVANIQSLRKKVDTITATFGTVIADEAHHAASKTYQDTIDKFKARYKLALTATIKRKDGMHVILQDYFGYNVHTTEKSGQMVPIIHSFSCDVPLSDNVMIPWALKVNAVYSDTRYYELCYRIVMSYIENHRTILFVSDRVDLLMRLAHETNQAYVTSDIKDEERERLKEALQNKTISALFGTYSIFSEGINIPSIDCLVIGMQLNNESLLEQLVGRAIRMQEGKKQPVIADIELKGSIARKQKNARFKWYVSQGYQIKNLLGF